MGMIADVQSSRDLRNIPINQVGVKGLRVPIRVRSATGEQATVATAAMMVFLPAEQKGTHMSRFVALLEEQTEAWDFALLECVMREMLRRLGSNAGQMSLAFPFFRHKAAPVSGIESLLDYDVSLSGEIAADGAFSGCLKVVVPVTSLCPCSKEISRYGAHNQRSHVTLTLHCRGEIAVEEVLDWVETQASCQLYGVLKRPDEKFVTEYAYDNPKFVEDMVRDIAAVLRADTRIAAFAVESENFESIHNHSAYAMVCYP